LDQGDEVECRKGERDPTADPTRFRDEMRARRLKRSEGRKQRPLNVRVAAEGIAVVVGRQSLVATGQEEANERGIQGMPP